MGSPDDGKSSEPFVLTELLGRAHINKLQIPIVLDHDVLRLEVTVDYILDVQVLHTDEQGANVEARDVTRQNSDLPNNIEEFRTADVLHQEVDGRVIFEASQKV